MKLPKTQGAIFEAMRGGPSGKVWSGEQIAAAINAAPGHARSTAGALARKLARTPSGPKIVSYKGRGGGYLFLPSAPP